MTKGVKDSSGLYEVERRAYHAARPGFRIAELQISPTQKVPWHYTQQCPRHVLCPGGNNPSLSPAAEGRGTSVAGPDFFRPQPCAARTGEKGLPTVVGPT